MYIIITNTMFFDQLSIAESVVLDYLRDNITLETFIEKINKDRERHPEPFDNIDIDDGYDIGIGDGIEPTYQIYTIADKDIPTTYIIEAIISNIFEKEFLNEIYNEKFTNIINECRLISANCIHDLHRMLFFKKYWLDHNSDNIYNVHSVDMVDSITEEKDISDIFDRMIRIGFIDIEYDTINEMYNGCNVPSIKAALCKHLLTQYNYIDINYVITMIEQFNKKLFDVYIECGYDISQLNNFIKEIYHRSLRRHRLLFSKNTDINVKTSFFKEILEYSVDLRPLLKQILFSNISMFDKLVELFIKYDYDLTTILLGIPEQNTHAQIDSIVRGIKLISTDPEQIIKITLGFFTNCS